MARKLITHRERLLTIFTSLLWKENLEMKRDVKVLPVFRLLLQHPMTEFHQHDDESFRSITAKSERNSASEKAN